MLHTTETGRKQFKLINEACISARDFRTACRLLDQADEATGVAVVDSDTLTWATGSKSPLYWAMVLERLTKAGVLTYERLVNEQPGFTRIQGRAWK